MSLKSNLKNITNVIYTNYMFLIFIVLLILVFYKNIMFAGALFLALIALIISGKIFKYNKTTIIVLSLTISASFLLKVIYDSFNVNEGMENSKNDEKYTSNDKSKMSNGISKEEYKKTIENVTKKSNNNDSQPIVPLTQNKTQTKVENNSDKTDEPFEVGRKSQKGGYNVDYASTIEDAYASLNEVIGSEGIKKLTDDTQRLMKQQMQMADAMKSMGPLIQSMTPLLKQAQGLLGNVNEGANMGNLAEMAKKFSASLSK